MFIVSYLCVSLSSHRCLNVLYFNFTSCYIQEIISCLILLSDCDWHTRLSYIFDIYKCSGNDELSYDDLVLANQVVAMSLHRLWGVGEWNQVEWSHLTEALADEAYAKVNIDEISPQCC